jgi:branched-chain amino acid transport system permease protein
MLLASLGAYVVLQNLISMSFGDDLKIIRVGTVSEGIAILGARMTGVQIVTVCVTVLLVASLAAVMKWTRLGKALRAVGDDSELAMASGIGGGGIMLWCFAFSSALAGIGGILVALDVGMVPGMGMEALMMAVVAVIVGGRGSVCGVMLAALLLGFTRHCGAWIIGSEWQDAIAFLMLLAFLVVRPEGVLGKKTGKAIV